MCNRNILTAGGLGQLIDGRTGDTDFSLKDSQLGISGYDWVGWRNTSAFATRPLQIVFAFDDVRNFTEMRLFMNNDFRRQVRVFSKVRVTFSVGGEVGGDDGAVVEVPHARDEQARYGRYVPVALQHGVGRFVKVQMYFDADWILLSEVEFDSGK